MKQGLRVVLVIVLPFALLLGLVWFREREPVYQGKTLSQWLAPECRYEASAEAIREMGTNTLPQLLSWATYETPLWKGTLCRASLRWSPRLAHMFYDKTGEYTRRATWGFYMLGPRASPAIPSLVRLMKGPQTNDAHVALGLLDGIGDEAVPALLDVLTNRQAYPCLRWSLAQTMQGPLTKKDQIVPVLIDCLKGNDSEVAAKAAAMLGSLRARPELAVPALISRLEPSHENAVRLYAIQALGDFGVEARAAVAPLLLAVGDPKDPLQHWAKEALRRIAPEEVNEDR